MSESERFMDTSEQATRVMDVVSGLDAAQITGALAALELLASVPEIDRRIAFLTVAGLAAQLNDLLVDDDEGDA